MDVFENEHCDYPVELEAAIALIERRINERLPQASGDRTDALAAIGLIKFWSTPLQNDTESLGFDDYLGAFIRTEFDSVEEREFWEVGFLKAHAVDSSRHVISIKHAKTILAKQNSLVATR
ncbi:hypothetical protein VCRA2110O2_30236 [Vibrio crassostreae]|nr:hypothetical protein VCHA44O286_50139 [Vibrio chagasii]CAK2864174.1 hypothetical protein VCRA2110O2_30236 [Vibrio crassostreae]